MIKSAKGIKITNFMLKRLKAYSIGGEKCWKMMVIISYLKMFFIL